MLSPKYGFLHKHYISSPCPKHFNPLKESLIQPDYGASKEDIHLNTSIFSEEKPFVIDFLHNKDLGARKLPLNISASSALIKIKLKEMPEEDLNEIALSLTLGVLKIKKGTTISNSRLLHLVHKMLLSAPKIQGKANQLEQRRFTQVFHSSNNSKIASCTWYFNNYENSITGIDGKNSYAMRYDFSINSLNFYLNDHANGLLIPLERDTPFTYIPFVAIFTDRFIWYDSCPDSFVRAKYNMSITGVYVGIPSLKQLARKAVTALLPHFKSREALKTVFYPKVLKDYILKGQLALHQLHNFKNIMRNSDILLSPSYHHQCYHIRTYRDGNGTYHPFYQADDKLEDKTRNDFPRRVPIIQ